MITAWSDAFRAWRRSLKAAAPYVRRREYRKITQRYDQLTHDIAYGLKPASAVDINALMPSRQSLCGEVCFFVTFADQPYIKHYVVIHIKHLLSIGVHVVLVVNTDIPHTNFSIAPEILNKLSGIYVRKNSGYDFAAWAHVYMICGDKSKWSRLYLINDSIVGPLDIKSFHHAIERIRISKADFLGLTHGLIPQHHLQSFFLVFNCSLLQKTSLEIILQRIVCLECKEHVIDIYETRLTQMLVSEGFIYEVLFPTANRSSESSNDVYYRWEQLLQLGFPYIKASVLRENSGNKKVLSRIPAEFHQTEN